MESGAWEIVQLELKYCERCGALWLRRRGMGTVYCTACSSEIAHFPFFRRKISRPHLPGEGKIDIESRNERLGSLAGKGQYIC